MPDDLPLDEGNGSGVTAPAENSDVTAAPTPRGAIGRPWRPGQSGNPGGRPRALREVLDLARQHTVRAIERLRELVESEDESVALRAAESLLDRAWGKPAEAALADRLAELEERLGFRSEAARRP